MNHQKNKIFNHPQQVIRTPFFSTEDCLFENFDKLKPLIKISSPDFYKTIRPMTTCEKDFNKVFFTTWKYFNRAKYRAVPFGNFASVAIGPKEPLMVSDKITLEENLTEHTFKDWDDKELLVHRGKLLLQKAFFLVNNATLYSFGQRIRFVRLDDGKFEISEMELFEELQFLCDYCRVPQEKKGLYKQLSDRYDLNEISITRLLIQLLDNQVLLTDCQPNIIGEDFFKRINASHIDTEKKFYRIAQRKYISGPANIDSFNDISQLIGLLNSNLPYVPNPDLSNFCSAFKRKFDRQIVPLSVALDPELGVGYANLEIGKGVPSNQSFEIIFNAVKNTKQSPLSLNPLFVFILTESCRKNVVELERFKTEDSDKAPTLPNSFSMLYHKWNNQIVIHHIGGCTANTLIGRFSLCGGDFEELCTDIAKKEQQANPGAVFFDVGYQAEQHVDNINRRKQIYEYELPLFSWCDADNLLQLDDILVSVDRDEIVLSSIKLGKRLVPRIPTAYNYTRSDFSLYRFLSDLQHQSVRSDLSLPIRKYIPGQAHYARIVYRQIILSPEMWLVDKEIIQLLINSELETGINALTGWLLNNKVSRLFSTGKADQHLTFDATAKDDLAALFFYCRQNHTSEIYLSEALINGDTGINNEKGKQYHGEFLTVFYHYDEIYKRSPIENCCSLTGIFNSQRKLPPGGEWLYFEIYCHPARVNYILLRIKGVVDRARSIIKKWFFIRYNENGHHIRFRIALKNEIYYATVLDSINKIFKPDLHSGLIGDIQIKTYVRELERYSKAGIAEVETFFYEDSRFVLDVLKNEVHDEIYRITLKTMRLLLSCTFDGIQDQLSFIIKMAELFSEEFALDHSSYKSINRNYEELKRNYKLDIKYSSGHARLKKAYCKLLECCPGDDDRHVLLADLLHMHVNRVFEQDSRKHEAILYQYLLKDMKKCRQGSMQLKQS